MEREKQGPVRPHVAYSEIFDTIDGHKDISFEERIQVKAIDIMVEALMTEPNFQKFFGGFTLGDKARLTDKRNPNYGEDLLMSVHTPEEFFVIVDYNYKPEIDDKGMAVGNGLMHRWGEKMSEIAQTAEKDLADEVEAKSMVRELIRSKAIALDLDTEPTLV